MVTARDAIRDRVRGLDAGADDYLPKPFAFDELLARLRALLRRSSTPGEGGQRGEVLQYADLVVDVDAHEVHRGDVAMQLTRTEFSLLELLIRNPRRVLERAVILDAVWGYDFPTTANSLEVYIGYLRRKTEVNGLPRLIHTVRGIGYVLRDTPP
jgi:two-component system response regulator MprA